MQNYTSIKNQIYQNETIIERSKFISYAKGIDSVEDAVAFVDSIKKNHYDANHNCFAYVFDGFMKYSDDGEPQGTAGLPILECIKNKNLNRVCVVVTRYFGGIKLGAGGLVRAYSGGCSAVLNIAEAVNFASCKRVKIEIEYSFLKPVQRALADLAVVENTDFLDKVTLNLLILAEKWNTICDIVVEISNGKAKIEEIEQLLYPYPTN